MPEIVKLRTLYCGKGTSDKIYGLAIVKQDNGFFRFFTFHGGRTEVIHTLARETASSSGQLLSAFNKILNEKQRTYEYVAWRDPYYNMVDTVCSLGTPPDEVATVSTPVPAPVVKPKSAPKSSAKPQSPKISPVWDRMADGLREF